MTTTTDSTARNLSNAEKRVITIKTEDDQPVKYTGNPAELPGVRHEIRKALMRAGAFKLLISNNASRLPNGVVCVEDLDNILFVTETISDPHAGEYNFENPCPDTATRVSRYNAERIRTGESTFNGVPSVAMLPDKLLKLAQPNKDEVETEALAYALTQLSVFEDRVHANELLVECDYDGRQLGPILDRIEKTALAEDITLVVGRRNAYREAGLNGQPLTHDSFRVFFKGLNEHEYKCPAHERMDDNQKSQIIGTLFIRDPARRKTWSEHVNAPMVYSTDAYGARELVSGPPQTFRDAKALAEKLLRSTVTLAGIDELSSPSKLSLSVEQQGALAAANVDPSHVGDAEAIRLADALLSASASSGPLDPRKNIDTAVNAASISVPKGDDGKYLYWAPPMSLCECGTPDQGRHIRYKWPCNWYRKDGDAESKSQGGRGSAGRGAGEGGRGKGKGGKGKGKGKSKQGHKQK